MLLHCVYLVLAVLAGVGSALGAVHRPGQFWIPLVVFVGVLVGLWVLHVVLVSLGSLLVNPKKKPTTVHTLARWVSVVTLDTFLAVCGVRCQVKGREKLPDRPFLMVINHLSLSDPLVAMVQFRDRNLAFISKKENERIPAIRRYMPACGCLFLDRDDSRAAIYTIREAAEHISSGLCSMAICPEGTRNKTDAPVLPFHAGSFKIATKAGCPLVIAGIHGSEKLFRNFPLRRTRIEVDILETIPAEQVTAAKSTDLAKHAEETIGNWIVNKRQGR